MSVVLHFPQQVQVRKGKVMREQVIRKDRIKERIDKIASVLEFVSHIFGGLMGGAMVCIVIAGVIARYVLSSPLAWSEELSKFLMIWMVLIGMSIVTRHRENLGVTFLVEKLPIWLQRIIKLGNDSLVMWFLVILAIEGLSMATRAKFQVAPSLGITMYYPLLSIPVGAALTIIQLALQMLIDLLSWGTDKSPYEVHYEVHAE